MSSNSSTTTERKLYTKTGDDGTTHLIGGRTKKSDNRIEALGCVDELNAHLGFLHSILQNADTKKLIRMIQHELFSIGSQLALGDRPGRKVPRTTDEDIQKLEQEIDKAVENLPPLHDFIVPAGTQIASWLHVARAVCRRAERKVVAVSDSPTEIRKYLNRLSDLLFALARLENQKAGVADIKWEQD